MLNNVTSEITKHQGYAAEVSQITLRNVTTLEVLTFAIQQTDISSTVVQQVYDEAISSQQIAQEVMDITQKAM